MVDEAVELADEVGLSKLTLAALAKRLGVRQPSLYKHVDGMDALQRHRPGAKHELADALARVAVGRLRPAKPSRPCHWRTGRGPASTRCSAALQRPATLATPRPKQPIVLWSRSFSTSWPVTNSVTRMPSTRPALPAALHGFVTLERSGGFGLPVDVDRSFDRLVRGLELAFSGWAKDLPRSRDRP